MQHFFRARDALRDFEHCRAYLGALVEFETVAIRGPKSFPEEGAAPERPPQFGRGFLVIGYPPNNGHAMIRRSRDIVQSGERDRSCCHAPAIHPACAPENPLPISIPAPCP